MRWFTFILASLATFRLSHLFTKERGPFAVFERQCNARWARLSQGMAQLYLLLFSLCKRAGLLDSLAGGNESQLGGMDPDLARV
jgi:hypothetical protein